MLVLTGEQKAEILIHLSIRNSWEPEVFKDFKYLSI